MSDLVKISDNSWTSKGNDILVSYFVGDSTTVIEKQSHLWDYHDGEITGNNIEVVAYDDFISSFNDIKVKKIKVSKKEADDFIENDKKKQKIKLTDEQKEEIKAYAKDY